MPTNLSLHIADIYRFVLMVTHIKYMKQIFFFNLRIILFIMQLLQKTLVLRRRVMSDRAYTMKLEAEMAAPLHLQRLERSLNVQPFLRQINDLFQEQVR